MVSRPVGFVCRHCSVSHKYVRHPVCVALLMGGQVVERIAIDEDEHKHALEEGVPVFVHRFRICELRHVEVAC
jgi:hypothetical protein